jgi:hypothetical protein
MVRQGEQLRDDQGRQNRIEVVGEDLLAITTGALWASSQERANADGQVWELVEHFVAGARLRIDRAIDELRGRNKDQIVATIGQQAVGGDYAWLSKGIIPRGLRDYLPAAVGDRHRHFAK